MGRSFHKAPSEILKIRDEVCALDFDLACTLRLLRFDNERELDRFKTLGMMLGGSDESETDKFEGKVTKDTQVW